MLNFNVKETYEVVKDDFYKLKTIHEDLLAKEIVFKDSVDKLKETRYSFGTNLASYIINTVSQRFCTVTQLLNAYVSDENLINKHLFNDFIYIYEDAIGIHRLIYPLKFVAYSIYDRKEWKKGNFQKHEEDYIIKFIKDFKDMQENWYADIERADSLNTLSKAGIQVKPAFKFIDRQRNLPNNSKEHRISIYNKNALGDEQQSIIDGQKLIIQLNNFLTTNA